MWRDRHGGDSLVKMEVEIGVMLSQAMGHMKPPEAGRGKVGLLSWGLRRGNGLSNTLISEL